MKIVVGYDPPHPNAKLLERVVDDALRYNAHVYLVTSPYDGRGGGGEELERREEELQKAKAVLDRHNITSETHLLVGQDTPGMDIVAFAEEKAADEIIIQIKKTSRVGKLLTGSNAQYIILNAPCSVVSVR